MDQIFISQLRLEAIIGVYPEERLAPQPITLDIELEADIQKALQSDHIGDTIDYAVVVKKVQQWAAEGQFQLVEALAQDLAEKILQTFAVQTVRIKLYKRPPGLPVASVGVMISRENPEKGKIRLNSARNV